MVTLKAVSILAFTSWNTCASALGDIPRCFSSDCMVIDRQHREGRKECNMSHVPLDCLLSFCVGQCQLPLLCGGDMCENARVYMRQERPWYILIFTYSSSESVPLYCVSACSLFSRMDYCTMPGMRYATANRFQKRTRVGRLEQLDTSNLFVQLSLTCLPYSGMCSLNSEHNPSKEGQIRGVCKRTDSA